MRDGRRRPMAGGAGLLLGWGMKITLWGINYAPESVGIGPFNRELCEYLASRGHVVSAVTSFPYYPSWSKEPDDRRRWFRTETVRGVRVLRCGCYVPAAPTNFRRILHELSFGLVSTLRLLFRPRADVYVVVSPPLGLGFFAWVVATLKRSRFVFHVQDLQPDAAVGLGMVRTGWFTRALYALERLAYAKATAVSGISEGMMTAFRHKGVPPDKCVLLPNWVRGAAVATSAGARAEARRFFDIADDTLLAVYSGNLGRKQNLKVLIDAAGLLMAWPKEATGRIKLIIAGDGAARSELEEWLRTYPRPEVLQLLPLLSDKNYAALLAATDVALITQAAGTGQFFLPSKLLSVLAAGLPVIAVADASSELAQAVYTGRFGVVVPPDDAMELSALLRGLVQSPGQLAAWARQTGWVQQYSRAAILPRFEEVLRAVAWDERIPATTEPRTAAAA